LANEPERKRWGGGMNLNAMFFQLTFGQMAEPAFQKQIRFPRVSEKLAVFK